MNIIKEILNIVLNTFKKYLSEKFLEMKKFTKFLTYLTIIIFIKMIYDIYKGYSKGLKLSNIIVCIPFTSLIFALIIPFFLALYFISSSMKRKNEDTFKSSKLSIFKASCCLQVYFYMILTILVHLISTVTYDLVMNLSIIIFILIVVTFFALYVKKFFLTKLLNTIWGYAVITGLYIIYGFCIQMLTSIFALTFDVVIIVGLFSFLSYLNPLSIDSIHSIEDKDIKKLQKYFENLDSYVSSMIIIVIISIIVGAIYITNIEDSGKNLFSFETTYTEIKSPINFKEHKNANGYLLFTTN